MRAPTQSVACVSWRQHGFADGERIVPEETAVALTYDGGSYAVMMATPRDLEDFALGFSLTEGIIAAPGDIRDLTIVEEDAGDRSAHVARGAARGRVEPTAAPHRRPARAAACAASTASRKPTRQAPRVSEDATFAPARHHARRSRRSAPRRSSTGRPARCTRRRSGGRASGACRRARGRRTP